MTVTYILDKDGNPEPCEDPIKWSEWFSNADRNVKKTVVGDEEISTVFLGVVHPGWSGAIFLYETMIFGGKHHGHYERYCTRKEALAGHRDIVRRVISRVRNNYLVVDDISREF